MKRDPYTVNIGDSKPIDHDQVLLWCQDNDEFVGVIKTDVSDVSYIDDYVYSYMFETEEAANWFKLRWL
jgi:hypothetical protein